MKCIEQKPQTDDGEQSPQPDHQWQSNNTSILTNTSISTPSLPSSTTSSDELLPASQISVAHGSPSMYSSTGSVGSLSTSSPLSANSAPSSSPHSPLPQPQSSNPFPLSSALALDSSASPAGSNFSGVSNIAQTTSWISSQRQDQQPIPDIAQVPVHSVVTQEVQSGVQRPSDTQNGVQSSPIVENRVQSPPSVSGSTFSTSSTDSGVILPALQNFSSGGSLSPDSCSPYNSPISTVSALPSSVWSPEMGTGLHTAVSTDSIPSATSASVPFQNSPQTSDFVPQAPPINNTFNPQLPSDFNFSGNTSYSQNFDNSDFVPGLDFTMLEPQQFNGSSIPQIHPGDSVLQHILDEMITLNDDSDFSAVPTIPGNGTVNVDTTFIPHSMPGSNSNSSTPFQGFIPEVQDIFQQFS